MSCDCTARGSSRASGRTHARTTLTRQSSPFFLAVERSASTEAPAREGRHQFSLAGAPHGARERTGTGTHERNANAGERRSIPLLICVYFWESVASIQLSAKSEKRLRSKSRKASAKYAHAQRAGGSERLHRHDLQAVEGAGGPHRAAAEARAHVQEDAARVLRRPPRASSTAPAAGSRSAPRFRGRAARALRDLSAPRRVMGGRNIVLPLFSRMCLFVCYSQKCNRASVCQYGVGCACAAFFTVYALLCALASLVERRPPGVQSSSCQHQVPDLGRAVYANVASHEVALLLWLWLPPRLLPSALRGSRRLLQNKLRHSLPHVCEPRQTHCTWVNRLLQEGMRRSNVII